MELRSTAGLPPASGPQPPVTQALRAQPNGTAATAAIGKVETEKADEPALDSAQLAEAVKSINMVLQDRTPGLEFAVDADTQRTVVKVVDRDTQEVIRQMPSREALEIAKALDSVTSLLKKQSV